MKTSEKLLNAVSKSEAELLKLADKHLNLNRDFRDSIRTNGIAGLGISTIAIINHFIPNLPDSIRGEMDDFVERLPNLAKDIDAVAYGHCDSKEEGARFFSELAMNGKFIEPEKASTAVLNGAYIVRCLYNIRVQKNLTDMLKRANGPTGLPGSLALVVGHDCFGEENATAVFMELMLLMTSFIDDVTNSLVRSEGKTTSAHSSNTGQGCLIASIAIIVGFSSITYSIITWASH